MADSPGVDETAPLLRARRTSEKSPSGLTPLVKKQTKRQGISKKKLSFHPKTAPVQAWTEKETLALLEFLMFHKSPEVRWVREDCEFEFWEAASNFIHTRTSPETENIRSGIIQYYTTCTCICVRVPRIQGILLLTDSGAVL